MAFRFGRRTRKGDPEPEVTSAVVDDSAAAVREAAAARRGGQVGEQAEVQETPSSGEAVMGGVDAEAASEQVEAAEEQLADLIGSTSGEGLEGSPEDAVDDAVAAKGSRFDLFDVGGDDTASSPQDQVAEGGASESQVAGSGGEDQTSSGGGPPPEDATNVHGHEIDFGARPDVNPLAGSAEDAAQDPFTAIAGRAGAKGINVASGASDTQDGPTYTQDMIAGGASDWTFVHQDGNNYYYVNSDGVQREINATYDDDGRETITDTYFGGGQSFTTVRIHDPETGDTTIIAPDGSMRVVDPDEGKDEESIPPQEVDPEGSAPDDEELPEGSAPPGSSEAEPEAEPEPEPEPEPAPPAEDAGGGVGSTPAEDYVDPEVARLLRDADRFTDTRVLDYYRSQRGQDGAIDPAEGDGAPAFGAGSVSGPVPDLQHELLVGPGGDLRGGGNPVGGGGHTDPTAGTDIDPDPDNAAPQTSGPTERDTTHDVVGEAAPPGGASEEEEEAESASFLPPSVESPVDTGPDLPDEIGPQD